MVIPNGYDSEDVEKTDINAAKNEKFSLAHIGSLTKSRNPINLWKAIKQLVDENSEFASDIEIHNIGKLDINVADSLKSFGLEKYLRLTDYLPHDKVISEQKNATLLLLLVNDTPNAKLILTGKIFEYLVSGTPIICIAPLDGDAAHVIRETSCGSAYGFDEIDGLKGDLLTYYQKFRKGSVVSDCRNIEEYERKNLTVKLAEVLDSIAD